MKKILVFLFLVFSLQLYSQDVLTTILNKKTINTIGVEKTIVCKYHRVINIQKSDTIHYVECVFFDKLKWEGTGRITFYKQKDLNTTIRNLKESLKYINDRQSKFFVDNISVEYGWIGIMDPKKNKSPYLNKRQCIKLVKWLESISLP